MGYNLYSLSRVVCLRSFTIQLFYAIYRINVSPRVEKGHLCGKRQGHICERMLNTGFRQMALFMSWNVNMVVANKIAFQ